jgi:hypothetical protein
MISYVALFGKTHIDTFFECCLHSLMSPGNLPAIEGVDLFLLIATIKEDELYIKEKLEEYKTQLNLFKNVKVLPYIVFDIKTNELYLNKDHVNSLIYNLFINCIKICYKSRMPFLFIGADQIFTDGTIGSSWDLYKATGKVVAVLNFRIERSDKSLEYYRNLVNFSFDLKRELLENITFSRYRSMADFEDRQTNFPISNGDYGVISGDHLMLFTSTPNPMIGRFQGDDLQFFAEHPRFNVWDYRWVRYLYESNRLVVQTNADIALTVEPEPVQQLAWKLDRGETRRAQADKKFERLLGDVADQMSKDGSAERRRIVDNPINKFCFSMRIDDVQNEGS